MSLDFSNRNLQGCSFRGQNLTGANFTGSDIRGCDFQDTLLREAKFENTKAGLQNHQSLLSSGISILLSVLLGFITVFAAVFTGYLLFPYSIEPDKFLAVTFILILFAVFLVATVKKNLRVAFGLVTVFAVVLGAVLGLFVKNRMLGVGAGIVAVTLTTILSAFMIIAVAINITLSTTVAGIKAGIIAMIAVLPGSIAGSIAGTTSGKIALEFLAGGTAPGFKLEAIFNAMIAAATGTLVGVLIASYIAFRVKVGDEKFKWISFIAVVFGAIGGTSFQGANLTNADFNGAILKNTDFTNANLTRTNFHLAKKLDLAKLNNTILINPKVRDLLVNKKAKKNVKSYAGCNFKGANLSAVDLSYTDLTAADISEATFVNSRLEGANLTQTQAIATDFQYANFTAACLSAWNIDSTTNIDEVICDYVYLENNQQERRPSSGEFQTGEFTKLFQIAINTVDLIFRNGLDLQVLSDALKKLQIENPGTQLGIKSIENKGDGVVVVRLDVPFDADKAKIHSDLTQNYQQALTALENSYQAQLKSKDEQITLYQQHQENLQEVIKMLGGTTKQKHLDKLAVIKLSEGELNTGFPVTLQISLEGERAFLESNGKLPSAFNLIEAYNKWQAAYRQGLRGSSRLNIPDTQVTNISKRDLFFECDKLAENLRKEVNNWFNSSTFRPIKEQLLEKLNPSESIRILLQTEDNQLRRVPFQLWDFFERYTKAEIALSSPSYERLEKSISPHATVKILAIIGDSKGIDVEKDRTLIEQLPNAKVTFLVEPQRDVLNDELWLQSWDILFFAGHSSTQSNLEIGHICINQTDSLTVAELKNALSKAIEQGLHLAIFNSCDGLGLAVNLADLHIPQMIVMREPVPDKVATVFLKNFLREFSHGKPLYQSVREARCQLQGLEYEFPCASWLPVIFQNPAEIDTAPTAWWNF
ncbi:rfrA pentapeptide repeat-containing protein (plasmid) [Calothrix parasitica NIES-267]|uniref:RfrA pentapeptide repeat-containing protein n=1 Tax=Calothrix parasitica NIES-267 TaxID=1973488 RepID=A0A1Z4M2H3_9CYAN|nr:rfrA pentapeptide repeat-containing protein [Calothrix parasitica NIES-267]